MVTAEGEPFVANPSPVDSWPSLGAQLEVGFPDGAGAAAMVNPTRWLRVHVAGLTNAISAGIRLGVTVLPLVTFFRFVRPIFGIDAGYFFRGDATWFPGLPNSDLLKSALKEVSYGFGSAQLGLELGTKNVSFVIRGGLSYVDLSLGNSQLNVGGGVLTTNGVGLRGVVPSARLGLMICFL